MKEIVILLSNYGFNCTSIPNEVSIKVSRVIGTVKLKKDILSGRVVVVSSLDIDILAALGLLMMSTYLFSYGKPIVATVIIGFSVARFISILVKEIYIFQIKSVLKEYILPPTS